MSRVVMLTLLLIIVLLSTFIVDICFYASFNAYEVTMDYLNVSQQQRTTFTNMILMIPPYAKLAFGLLAGAILFAILVVLGTALRSKPETGSELPW